MIITTQLITHINNKHCKGCREFFRLERATLFRRTSASGLSNAGSERQR